MEGSWNLQFFWLTGDLTSVCSFSRNFPAYCVHTLYIKVYIFRLCQCNALGAVHAVGLDISVSGSGALAKVGWDICHTLTYDLLA